MFAHTKLIIISYYTLLIVWLQGKSGTTDIYPHQLHVHVYQLQRYCYPFLYPLWCNQSLKKVNILGYVQGTQVTAEVHGVLFLEMYISTMFMLIRRMI